MDELIGFILIAILVIAGVVLYCWLSWLLLIHVMFPVFIIVAGIGTMIGVAIGFIGMIRVFCSIDEKLCTPEIFRNRRIERRPPTAPQNDPDEAWPEYFVRQMLWDIGNMATLVFEPYFEFGGTLFELLDDSWGIFVLWPIPITIGVFYVTAGLGAAIALAILALVTLLAAVVGGLIWLCLSLVLRSIEGSWRRLVRGDASCPYCFHVSRLPAYRCPGCESLHRDIRPRSLGLFFRRCSCDQVMPTMVLRAAWKLEAECQSCGRPLRRGSAAIRDLRFPIFGATSAGKTRFLDAALDRVTVRANEGGVDMA